MWTRKYKNLGPLHELLLKACPPDPETGVKSIPVLAKTLELSNWGIYRWIEKGRIPPKQAMRVVEISEGRVSLSNFDPFVYVD